jgi:hypothetical protein
MILPLILGHDRDRAGFRMRRRAMWSVSRETRFLFASIYLPGSLVLPFLSVI